MRKVILVIIIFVVSINVYANADKDRWLAMTEEQQMYFVLGVLYGIFTESFNATGEDVYGVANLPADKGELFLSLITVGFIYDPEVTTRDAILRALKIILAREEEM